MVNFDYLYNPAAAREALNKNYFLDKKLGFQIIENGMILPHNHTDDDGKWTWVGLGGVVDSEGKFVKDSYVHHGSFKTYTPPQNQFSTARNLSSIWGCPILFGGTA